MGTSNYENAIACSGNEFDSSSPKGNAGAGLVPPGWPQPMYRLPLVGLEQR